jgi:hypothetical protein
MFLKFYFGLSKRTNPVKLTPIKSRSSSRYFHFVFVSAFDDKPTPHVSAFGDDNVIANTSDEEDNVHINKTAGSQ